MASSVVSLPDKTWGVQIDLSGFTVTFRGVKPDSRGYLVAKNDTSGVIISVALEEMPPSRSAMNCKEIMNAHVALAPDNIVLDATTEAEKKNVKIWQARDKTFLVYRIPSIKAPGQKRVEINQENRFLCFQHDNVFVDLHLSKANFMPGEETLFAPIFDSIKIFEGLKRTSMDYFLAGSSYYDQDDFKRAIPPYAQALALEQQDPKLEKKLWHVLVDNLGMAYGVTGDLEAARKIFEFGIQKDADYPMFYYEMAAYFGEKGDMQSAMTYLQQAYDRRGNFMPGENPGGFFHMSKDSQKFFSLLLISPFCGPV